MLKGPLVLDSAGDIFGVTYTGGANNAGTLYELGNSLTGYASAPTLLTAFDAVNLANPSGLIKDSVGNLFGAARGGTYGVGAIYKIAKTGASYSSPPTVIASLQGSPGSAPYGLKMDGAGDIFGVIDNTVFEFAASPSPLDPNPRTLATFGGSLGSYLSGVVLDAKGDVFVVTGDGGLAGAGAIYEIVKYSTGYAYTYTPQLLASLTGSPEFSPRSLTIDAAGNLFGATSASVFELSKIGSSYAAVPTLLATADDFHFASGSGIGAITLDAAGDVFGETFSQYAFGPGTVFEIAKAGAGYDKPATVATLNFAETLVQNSGSPTSALVADSSGNLFGVAQYGGLTGAGTLFEVSGVGFRVTARCVRNDFNYDGKSDILFRNANGALAVWEMNNTAIGGGGVIGNPGAGWTCIATGDFNNNGRADILFQYTNGLLATWEMKGTSIVGGGYLGTPGGSWGVVATGDFNNDGSADILFRDANNNFANWEINGTAIVGGGKIGNPGSGWTFEGVGDFNNDGRSDMLFENTSGALAVWNLNDASIIGGATLGNPGVDWSFKGISDFNGDGSSDLLFKNNSTGVYAIWDIANDAITGGGDIGAPGADWSLKAIGRFAGGGKSGLLFENSVSGDYATWNLNNTSIVGGGLLGNPGTSYSVAGGPSLLM